MRPLIGVMAYTDINSFDMLTSAIPLAYTHSVEKAGGVPIILPFSELQDSLVPMTAPIQGLLIPGGKDIDPEFYHEKPLDQLGPVDNDLDRFQMAVLELAIRRKLPILGICRGAQLINVAMGGNLFQDILTQFETPALTHMHGDSDTDHPIDIIPGSRLHALFGPHIHVNSHHHQSIKSIAPGLVITARAPDGVIEAAEHESLPIDLIQWHPERMMQKNDVMLPLFHAFVKKCGT